MELTKDGRNRFSSEGELYYHLIIEMGLAIDRNQHVYDEDTGSILMWKDKYIKCSVDDKPLYASKDEAIFSLNESLKLMLNVFSYYVTKISSSEDINMVIIAHYTDIDKDKNKTRLFVKYDAKDGSVVGQILTSEWFSDPWLAYADMIFKLNGTFTFDLTGLDRERDSTK